jgi:hypothetical protein
MSRGGFDFERLYRKYPRKMGKTPGMKKCKKEIKTEKDYQDLEKAIERFLAYHVSAETDAQFVPYFSTFMSAWRDWLDEEAGDASTGHAQIFDISKILEKRGEV